MCELRSLSSGSVELALGYECSVNLGVDLGTDTI